MGAIKIKEYRDTAIVRIRLRSLLDDLRRSIKMTIPPKSTVVIKPNVCTVKGPETGATVDPVLVKFLIEWLDDNYDISMFHIVESDATWLNADIAFKVLGWDEVFCGLPKVRITNLSKDEQVRIDLKGHLFDVLAMSRVYMEAGFFVSVGKLKTNDLCGMSCILKNQFGSLPAKYKAGFHSNLNEAIFDLNNVRIPDLCIVDGLVAMEGDGPVYGAPRPLGIILAGNDPVSVDHAAAKIMGLRIGDIPYLRYAIRHGLGSPAYETIGQGLSPSRTEFVHSSTWRNLASRVLQSRLLQVSPLWTALSKVLLKEDSHEED